MKETISLPGWLGPVVSSLNQKVSIFVERGNVWLLLLKGVGIIYLLLGNRLHRFGVVCSGVGDDVAYSLRLVLVFLLAQNEIVLFAWYQCFFRYALHASFIYFKFWLFIRFHFCHFLFFFMLDHFSDFHFILDLTSDFAVGVKKVHDRAPAFGVVVADLIVVLQELLV